MARFVTAIPCPVDCVTAFDYMANFEGIADWDPSVSLAEALTPGPPRVGSRFRIDISYVGRKFSLIYEILEFEPHERVVLEAHNSDFISYDVIEVAPERDGCRVTYDATLTLKGIRAAGDPLIQILFKVFGRRAEAGLREALDSLVSI